ncbi:MAG: DUF2934 domain-containing protein [Candidatus Omnitrophica bacterium]|nr:DUF2934 domain-containing protein [Candidatus Omnitrophota bacterium]
MGEHNCYKTDKKECIKKKAYELWEKNGRKKDHDSDYWLMAEKNLEHQKKNNDSNR